jgi:hypothetical protein
MATLQQPGYAECIQAFQKYVKAKQIYGSNSSSSEAKFIQFYALQDYFDANRMGKIFKQLSQPNQGNEIRQKNYLRVFSILVFIGKAEYITQFIRYPGLDDRHLPFLSPTHPPHNWPPPIEEFYPAFYSAQWQFCPQKFVRENLWNVCFEEDHILPIVEKMQMRKGRSAVIYKIKVLEQYNTLIHLVRRISVLDSKKCVRSVLTILQHIRTRMVGQGRTRSSLRHTSPRMLKSTTRMK